MPTKRRLASTKETVHRSVAARIPTISLVGCGGVGSRHLQALLKLGLPLRIQVAEPRRHAAEVGRARAEEIGVPREVRIEWHESLEDLSPADVTIVATLSSGRVALLERLIERGDRRFLIEKVVCQSAAEFSRLLASLADNDAKGWINCPRRYYTFYDRLKRDLATLSPVTVQISAGDRGLGCNAIHYVDLFHFLTGRLPTSLSGALSDGVRENRRGSDFVEFSGSIRGHTSLGDVIDITFSPAPFDAALVSVNSPRAAAFADESRYFAVRSSSSSSGGVEWAGATYGHRNVSDVTTTIVGEILANDDCRLATVGESAPMHSLLFDVFNDHLEHVTGTRPLLCPIT